MLWCCCSCTDQSVGPLFKVTFATCPFCTCDVFAQLSVYPKSKCGGSVLAALTCWRCGATWRRFMTSTLTVACSGLVTLQGWMMGECQSKFCLARAAPFVSVVLLMIRRRGGRMVLPGTCALVVWTTHGTVADRRSLPHALQLKPFTLLYRTYAIIYACATNAHSLFCCPSCLEAVHIRLRHVSTFRIVKII